MGSNLLDKAKRFPLRAARSAAARTGNEEKMQELEAVFRGAGWNVIKVIWGSKWDELLAADVDGVLLDRMNDTVDGDFQRYATESGAFHRDHFFGPHPRLRPTAGPPPRRGPPDRP